MSVLALICFLSHQILTLLGNHVCLPFIQSTVLPKIPGMLKSIVTWHLYLNLHYFQYEAIYITPADDVNALYELLEEILSDKVCKENIRQVLKQM